MDYILSFSISVSQQVHAHISVSSLPTCLGKKKKKIPSEWFEELAEQNRAKKKKNSSKTRVYETRVLLEKTEENRATSWTSRSKQSKTKKKKFPLELESMKLEFQWKKQSNPPDLSE